MNSTVVVLVNMTDINILSSNTTERIIKQRMTKLVSDEVAIIYVLFVYLVMLPINLTGFVTNAINMRVFARQGLSSDSTNISLFTLSLCEMLGCITMVPSSICWIVGRFESRATFLTCFTLSQFPFFLPHMLCTRISSWITVYVSVERALCVLMPLRVKTLIGPKVTIRAMICIWVILLAGHMPFIATARIGWRFHPLLNTTIAVSVESDLNHTIGVISSVVGSTILISLAVVIIFISTMLMIHKLNQSRRWRQSISNRGAAVQDEKSSHKPQSSKEIEVLKVVTMVTSIYLVCLTMSLLPSSVIFSLPGVSLSGINSNVFNMVFCSRSLFSAINATANFFGYIRISSKYRAAFFEVFPCLAPNTDAK